MKPTLIYDGSFDGFLSAVFYVFERKMHDAIIVKNTSYASALYEDVHHIETLEPYARRVWDGFKKKVNHHTPPNFYAAFLSEMEGMENSLLHFVQYVFASRIAIDTNFANADVLRVGKVAKMVHREKHRMEAFVRFQLTKDGFYYAVIEPDFDVIPLIKAHFTRRYADQKWIIYDVKRKYGLYYDLGKTEIVEIDFSVEDQNPSLPSISLDPGENFYQQLWKTYFKSVNITSRRNLQLHLKHVPTRYWKYLTEKI